MLNTNSNPTCPTRLNCFWIILFSPFLPPTDPHQYLFFVVELYVSISPHLLSRRGMPSTWTSSTPTPIHPLTLNAVPRTACLHLPSFLVRPTPPLHHQPTPRSLTAPWVLPVRVPLSPLCNYSSYLVIRISPEYYVVWIPNWVSISREGKGTGRLHSLSVTCPCPCPPATWTLRC